MTYVVDGHGEAASWNAADVEELLPVLRANSPKLRLLRLVCAENHTLVTVYQTAIGPVAVYRVHTLPADSKEFPWLGNRKSAIVWTHRRYDLAVVLEEDHDGRGFRPQCKCGPHFVKTAALTALLGEGKRRAAIG
jgi:hypothetical protein